MDDVTQKRLFFFFLALLILTGIVGVGIWFAVKKKDEPTPTDFDDEDEEESPGPVIDIDEEDIIDDIDEDTFKEPFDNRSCEGRNELGKFTNETALGCARRCLDKGCRSFDYNPDTKSCFLSHTCSYARSRQHSGWWLWERKSPINNQSDLDKFRWHRNQSCGVLQGFALSRFQTLSNTSNALECAKLCLEKDCKFFDYNPDTKLCLLSSSSCTQSISASGWWLWKKKT